MDKHKNESNFTYKRAGVVIAAPVGDVLADCLAPNTDDGIGTDNMTAICIYFPEQCV